MKFVENYKLIHFAIYPVHMNFSVAWMLNTIEMKFESNQRIFRPRNFQCKQIQKRISRSSFANAISDSWLAFILRSPSLPFKDTCAVWRNKWWLVLTSMSECETVSGVHLRSTVANSRYKALYIPWCWIRVTIHWINLYF